MVVGTAHLLEGTRGWALRGTVQQWWQEPFAGKEYLAIVRVPQANALIRIPLDAVDKSRFSKKPRARDLLKALLDQQPYV